MERVVVERSYPEPMTLEQVRDSACSYTACFERFRVRHLRTLRSIDGRRFVCEYEAPDAESVRRANDMARMAYDAIWTASVHESSRP